MVSRPDPKGIPVPNLPDPSPWKNEFWRRRLTTRMSVWSVAVEVGQCQASRGTWASEGGAGFEVAAAVVEVDEIAGAVVSYRDVQVSVAVEVGEGGGVGAGLFISEAPRKGEGGATVVEVDPVLSGPVAAVGDDGVEGTVAVYVGEAY